MNDALFHGELVETSRIIYTPSDFAKLSLFHIQEIGNLQATKPHTSKRNYLASYLFFMVLAGSGELQYEGATYKLDPGSCVFIDTRKNYSHTTSNDLWNISWIHFNGPTLANIYQKYKERGGLPAFKPSDFKIYLSKFEELYKTVLSQSYTKDMDINTGISSILSSLMKDSWHPEKSFTSAKKTRMIEIKKYLDENYKNKISLDMLSNKFNINKYYLTKVFKEQFGVSIMDYLLDIRITEAKNLLRFSSMSAEQIGLLSGIGDVYYFSRVFKKIEGISIREYRKQWT